MTVEVKTCITSTVRITSGEIRAAESTANNHNLGAALEKQALT